jgi:hypothetical protein
MEFSECAMENARVPLSSPREGTGLATVFEEYFSLNGTQ